jgi:glycosyltransferase involved in cell wall biosynthesis
MPEPRLLVYTDTHPDSATFQIRIAEPLRRAGVEMLLSDDVPPDNLERVIAQDVEAVLVHRGIRKRCRQYDALRDAARRSGKPLIYDIDDLLIQVDPGHPDFTVYQSRSLKALKVLVDADLVIASTPVLADRLLAFHERVVVVPNRLPASCWQAICDESTSRHPDTGNKIVTIGYVGTDTHRPDLELVEPALREVLSRRRGQTRLLSVGVPLPKGLRSGRDVELRMPPKRVRHSYRAFATYAAQLDIDVGIAPLVDNGFNRCKSDIKFQEYAALGVPGVYSDLPCYRDRVVSGTNGYLARDGADWVSHLGRLVESPGLRAEMGASAAREVSADWNRYPCRSIWQDILAQAEAALHSEPARHKRERVAAVVDDLLAYQTDLQRQLKRTVEYQIGNTIGKWFPRPRKRAA